MIVFFGKRPKTTPDAQSSPPRMVKRPELSAPRTRSPPQVAVIQHRLASGRFYSASLDCVPTAKPAIDSQFRSSTPGASENVNHFWLPTPSQQTRRTPSPV